MIELSKNRNPINSSKNDLTKSIFQNEDIFLFQYFTKIKTKFKNNKVKKKQSTPTIAKHIF
jgi:ABC-type uncharacterized transport system substrate-binding protein